MHLSAENVGEMAVAPVVSSPVSGVANTDIVAFPPLDARTGK